MTPTISMYTAPWLTNTAVRPPSTSATTANATAAAYSVAKATGEIWAISVELLDGCMKIGRQPDDVDAQIVATRMDAAREMVKA